ncbi:hypothetical protein [Rubritalea profundi]|uniref:Uncharacterized protein n=1 Tax=Rubritalea profundi TaxID=1658618 RepID=A0A2S7TX95_9BACT|nr:hypothetical protein [Rubritalea profundi]PQJ27376.1 hypothetical protein BSZ32_01930 [Rubritalea profundi]
MKELYLYFWAAVFSIVLLTNSSQAQEVPPQVGEDLGPSHVVETSTNNIQKIVVRGKRTKLRMAIASIANTMAKELHELLDEEDSYAGKRNIYIEMLDSKGGRSDIQVRPDVKPFGDLDLIIRLLVKANTRLNRETLDHGIIDVLLYRKGLEGVQTLDESHKVQVPIWLSYGIIETISWKKDSSKKRVLYELLLSKPELFPLDNVLSASGRDVRAFDATSETFFRAASAALVMSLLRQDGGRDSMRAFLSEVVLFDGEMDILLRKHFPPLSIGANAMQKVWSLQVAEMAAPKLVENLSIAETDQRLTEMLVLNIADGNGDAQLVPFEDFKILDGMTVAEKVQATEAMRQGVVQLSNRCHPIYRPLLLEYTMLASEMCQGELKNISGRLPLLAGERLKMVLADERVHDYLDWYQITRAHEVTGDFSGYMKLKERLAMEREERKDEVIDPYLDRVQALMRRDVEGDSGN